MITILRLAGVLLLAAAPVLGQGPLEPSRLPADVMFYLHWRGTRSVEKTRSVNSLLRLWADPEFVPARQALIERISRDTKKSTDAEPWTPEELEQALSLLENPLEIGVAGRLEIPRAPGASAGGAQSARTPAFFAILDTTGKTEIFSKLQDHLARAEKNRPTITRYSFGPTAVEKVVGPKQTYYQASVGNYFVRADEQALLEDLVTRLGPAEPPAASLGQAADYRSALRQFDSGALLEFFGRIPDASQFPLPAKEGFDWGAFARALHLEHLHTICGSLSLPGEATRLRFALLGDTSPGSPFDLAGDSSPTFSTLALAPAGATSYSVGRIHPAALYQTVRNAVFAGMTPKQRSNIELLEAVVANQIEMKIPEALELLRGEIASMTTIGDFDPFSQLYAATIQKKPELLRVLRTVLAAQISSEEQEGDTTYLILSIATPGKQAASPQRHFYYLGVTPEMLLAAPRKRIVREGIARLAASGAAGPAPLSEGAQFRRARARFPGSLSSLSYVDLTGVPWEKLAEEWRQSLEKSEKRSSSSDAGRAERLKEILPGVFSRHLHVLSTGSWKDRDGLYFDGYVE